MNAADIELIISIANDELAGQERIDALARINADPSLANELATQISMIDAVQSLPGADMTASERTTLHTNLVEQLHLDESPLPVVPARRSVSWWQPVVGLASVAVVVFAIVVVPNMLSSGSADDVAFQELSTTIAPEFAASGGSTETTTTAAAAADDASVAQDTATEVAPTITATVDAGEDLQLVRIPVDREEELNDLASGETSSELLNEKLARYGFAPGTTIDPVALQACIEALGDELPTGAPLAIGIGDTNTVFLGFDTGTGIDVIVEIDLPTCSITTQAP